MFWFTFCHPHRWQANSSKSFFFHECQAPTAGFQLSDLRVRIVVCVEFLHVFFLESSTENLRLNVKFHRQKVWFLGGFLKAQISDGGFRYSYRLYIIVYYIGSTPGKTRQKMAIFFSYFQPGWLVSKKDVYNRKRVYFNPSISVFFFWVDLDNCPIFLCDFQRPWHCWLLEFCHPVTVTTRIFPFLVGNPYKASFVTGILGGG